MKEDAMEASSTVQDAAIREDELVTIAEAVVGDEGFASVKDITVEFLIHSTADEWNTAVGLIRREDQDWEPDLSHRSLREQDFSGKNLRGADFTGSILDRSVFSSCDLRDATFSNASLYRANISYADVSGSNYRDASHWNTVEHEGTIGYAPPLRDVSADVARHFLIQAIADPNSEINEGLEELRSSGIAARWVGQNVSFWMTHEIQRNQSDCHDGGCSCEVIHSCEGCCDCCSCYRGECDCEPEHDYEDFYPTNEYYLATVIGHVSYEWSDTNGLSAVVSMSADTMHPHVNRENGRICWGDSQKPDSLRAADHLLRVMGWIGQHNPTSEYRSIDDLP